MLNAKANGMKNNCNGEENEWGDHIQISNQRTDKMIVSVMNLNSFYSIQTTTTTTTIHMLCTYQSRSNITQRKHNNDSAI